LQAQPFTEYTADDFGALVSTNLAGFIYITQLAVKQMQAQKSGGGIVSITAALADNPIAGEPTSLSMITKGGLNAGLRSLALEYAKEHIRFNAVAPGIVATSLQTDNSKEFLQTRSPMGTIWTVEDISFSAFQNFSFSKNEHQKFRCDPVCFFPVWGRQSSLRIPSSLGRKSTFSNFAVSRFHMAWSWADQIGSGATLGLFSA
jgi:NAD(P)-dependent dehydrogenase (short-subunit alcohol dehydrogenase family)